MIFRTHSGQLIEIKKYNYINDKLYYKKLLEIKQPSKQYISEKTFDNKNNK